MKEVIVEYVNAHGTPLTFHTGYFEQGGTGYDTTRDPDFIYVWSPHATNLFARSRVNNLTAIEETEILTPKVK